MENRKTNILQIILQICVWGFIFAIPFLMFWKSENVNFHNLFKHQAINILASLVVFYVNYLILTDKFLFRKKIWQFVILNIILIGSVGLLVYFLKDVSLLNTPPKNDSPHPTIARPVLFYMREVLSMLLVAGLSITFKLLSQWYKTESERQEEEKKRKEAELVNLRQQINPHFFFNTLNNIYALIAISPEKAQNTVLELSKLMRYVLYENNSDLVPINRELDFIKNYVELMRIRLTSNIDVQINIDVNDSEKLIAPMLFISLIENAFKHGVSHTQPSFIHIDIHQIQDRIICVIRNSYFPKDENDRSGSGIGLDNLHRRLDILYPHKHILRTEENDNVYISELIVPLLS